MLATVWDNFVRSVVYDKKREGRYIVYRTRYTRTAVVVLLLVTAHVFIANPVQLVVELLIGVPLMVGILARALDHARAVSRRIVRMNWNELEWYYELPQRP